MWPYSYDWRLTFWEFFVLSFQTNRKKSCFYIWQTFSRITMPIQILIYAATKICQKNGRKRCAAAYRPVAAVKSVHLCTRLTYRPLRPWRREESWSPRQAFDVITTLGYTARTVVAVFSAVTFQFYLIERNDTLFVLTFPGDFAIQV